MNTTKPPGPGVIEPQPPPGQQLHPQRRGSADAAGSDAPAVRVAHRRHAQVEKRQEFGAEFAFFTYLPRDHWLRRPLIRLVSHRYFDRLIVLAIVANSVILGLSDFSVVDSDLNPASTGVAYSEGQVVPATSLANRIVELSESPFTALFTAECVIKIIAMGFCGRKGSYLRDSWNMLDFVVVISSLVGILPSIPNVSAIRTIRVLRPLRSLSVIPGMRRLISALLKALPALGNVVILQIFVFFIFGILGIQLFSGSMNRRCRLTEFPVLLPVDELHPHGIWPVSKDYLDSVLANPAAFRCLNVSLESDDSGTLTKETSPWRTPQDCFWPVDTTDELLCALPGQAGNHQCAAGSTCGSNYDTFGNRRFTNSRIMNQALYVVSLDYGYTTFDHVGRAFFTIFQSITQEGWTSIMYMVMDSSQPALGAALFVVLIIFGSFFVMNLTLAVISDEFNIDDSSRGPTAEEKKALLLKAAEEQAKFKPHIHWLYRIVSHPVFSGIIMVVIFANTAVLALDHYPMPPQMDADLEIVNFALSCVFLVEMFSKLIGLGLRQYARDRFNLFDAFIVSMSVLETIASPPSFMSDNPVKKGAVSALRSFRLFRVFKLARNWRSLRELLEMIVRAVASIANFAVLLFLFIYIYALVGLQFFGNTMRFDDDGYPTPFNKIDFWNGTVPRSNFDTLLWSAVTVFQIITGENWNNVMYDGIRGNGMASSIYFITLVILGNFVLMNLFLALLLDNFGSDDEEQIKAKEEDTKKLAQKMSVMKVAPMTSSHDHLQSRNSLFENVKDHHMHHHLPEVDEGDEDARPVDLDELTKELERKASVAASTGVAQAAVAPINESPAGSKSKQQLAKGKTSSMLLALNNLIEDFNKPEHNGPSSPTGSEFNDEFDANEAAFAMSAPMGRSLFLFSKDSRVRKWAFNLIAHPYFDSVILALITISSIALAVDNPLANPAAKLPIFLTRLDTVFAIIFAAEMVIKIIALGLVLGKTAYLRSAWNVLDCLIVISSLVMLGAQSSKSGSSLKSLRSLRTLRTFRPLRMITRRPGLKLVVNALIQAIPAVLNVLFVCGLFYLIFSIVAVNYLKGKFYKCSGTIFDGLSDAQQDFLTSPQPWDSLSPELRDDWFPPGSSCAGFPTSSLTSRYICGCWGADWGETIPQNFNNVGWAMLTFFEISTTEGWVDVMVTAIDATDIDMQPVRDHNMNWAFFFVAFIMVGSFFVVNLFVGVIIDNFNRMKAALGGDFMLTPEQKKWIEAQKAASRVGPIRVLKPFKHPVRRAIFVLVRRQRFEWTIMVCIIGNTLLMATQYFGQSTEQSDIINVINEIFAVVFTVEAVLKLIAFGLAYFEDTWNRFDFGIVVGTLVSIVVEALTGTHVRSLAMLVRVIRVTRILRLVKASKGIRQILLTLYISLPGLSNITSILFLMLFIYTTMGVQMFATVALSDNIDTHANFQNFGTGFLFLLRSATGEAWDACMHDLASRPAGCVDEPPYDPTMCGFSNAADCIPLNGCGNPIAFVFFCSFTLLVTYVMLNLTIAVILEGFSLSHEDEEPLFEPELLNEFQLKWSEVDPKATGFVSVTKLWTLVAILEAPLVKPDVGFNKAAFLRYVCELRLPLYEGETLNFTDILLAMAREMVKETVAADPNAIGDMMPVLDDAPSRLRLEFPAHEYFAVIQIQRCVAAWLRMKRQLERQYMEEYKNKIKKPSGRPKKQRDARVFTIG